MNLRWQSKLILLLVVPFAATGLVLEINWWSRQYPAVAIWTIGLSLLLALVVLKVRAATLTGAAAGAVITASLMFSTVTFPYQPWHTALPVVLTVSLLAWLSTRLGKQRKEELGIGEDRHGRSAAQVAANLGLAAIASHQLVQSWMNNTAWLFRATAFPGAVFALGLAAMAEAAADTVSSEIGQVLGGRPRMITTLRAVRPGADGAISPAGTAAGIAAALIVAAVGTFAFRGALPLFAISSAGAVFGLLFDSLLGATLEHRGWLNNNAVNFLSTTAAAVFALASVWYLN